MVRLVRELVTSIVMAFVLYACINSITARNFVQGPSMEPTLHRDQVLLVSRVGMSGFSRQAYASTHTEQGTEAQGWIPPRGSIVILVHPTDPQTTLVKRVIGLPGEEIAIRQGQVLINGEPLAEPYVVYGDTFNLARRHIPEDALFVMGDNRPQSSDSRAFGPVPRINVLGVAILRYWPFPDFKLLTP